MITTEHIQTAQDSLDKSDRYFAEGDELQGSEKTWGAAAHAVMAVAQQRGWNYGDHRSLKIAVSRLADELDDPFLETAFGIAEKFHANFHHKFMHDHEFDIDQPTIRLFVQCIPDLASLEVIDQTIPNPLFPICRFGSYPIFGPIVAADVVTT